MTTLRLGSRAVLAALPLLCLTVAGRASAVTKIACIGEQTTKSNEANNLWPVLLQTDLGATYTVVNDSGNTNDTLLSGYPSNANYCPVLAPGATDANHAEYADSLTANIVVLGPFGEHDERAVQANMALGTEQNYQTSIDTLVMTYLNHVPPVKVYLSTPIYLPNAQLAAGTNDLITNIILPAVKAVAMAHAEVTLVDMYTPFGVQTTTGTYFNNGPGDGQTNAAGEKEMETLVLNAIKASSGGAGGTGGAGGAGGTGGAAGAAGAGGSSGGAGGASAAGAGGASAGAGGGFDAGGAPSAGAPSAGAPSAGAPSAGAPSGTAGASTVPTAPSSSSDSGGCTIAVAGSNGWNAGLLLAMASALGLARRRRQRARG